MYTANAELKNAPSPRSKLGGVGRAESLTSTTAFQIQEPVTTMRMPRYVAFDFVEAENLVSRIAPVIMFPANPTTAVRKEAKALERTVKFAIGIGQRDFPITNKDRESHTCEVVALISDAELAG